MNRLEVLSARDLLNYDYCPRIIYFEHVLHQSQTTTIKEFKGREKHSSFIPKAKRDILITEKELRYSRKEFNIPLSSIELGIQTVADCVLFNDKDRVAAPMQFKNSKTPDFFYHSLKDQLALEAMLIKEVFRYNVGEGYIRSLADGNTIKIGLSERDFNITRTKVMNIIEIISKEYIPRRTEHWRKCVDCCFRRICTS